MFVADFSFFFKFPPETHIILAEKSARNYRRKFRLKTLPTSVLAAENIRWKESLVRQIWSISDELFPLEKTHFSCSVNAITLKDRLPIPSIKEILDELYGTSCFSKLDLYSGCHQIRMEPNNIHKNAFRTHRDFCTCILGYLMPLRLLTIVNISSIFIDLFE